MKKCVLVNCFASSNEMRVEPIREVLEEEGYDTTYISSDFHHATKQYTELDKSIVPIHVRAYNKNISIKRLCSHKEFSDKVYNYLCKEQPELIYIKFPPNTLVKAAFDYKLQHNCKIILDIFDLWPESLPVSSKLKKVLKPYLKIWAGYRDKYVSCADLLLSECKMYQSVLSTVLPFKPGILYLTKEDIDYHYQPATPGEIHLCYLGGINNLVDIEKIGHVIHQLCEKAKISLDIIGDGKQRNELIRIAEKSGASICFHGVIYDEHKKNEIMSKCDFGLNIIKSSARIALSLKSIEYFRAGLGVINNIPYDTERIIEEEKAGFNLSNNFCFDYSQVNTCKQNARKVYEEYFSISTFKTKFKQYFSSIL